MKKKNRNGGIHTVKNIFFAVAVLILTGVLIYSYCYFTGGNKRATAVDPLSVADSEWSGTLSYAYTSANKAKAGIEDSLLTLTNGSISAETDMQDISISRLRGLESGKTLFYSLPAAGFVSEGRIYGFVPLTWEVPVNSPYSAQASCTGEFVTEGTEEEFVPFESFSFTSKSDVTGWSLINRGCELSLSDDTLKVSVASADNPYFGNGRLSVNLNGIVSTDRAFIRLRVRGSGVTAVEVNYSAKYDNVRLQGAAAGDISLTDDWTYITLPVDGDTFRGELYSLYFRLTADSGAVMYIDTVEIGTVSRRSSGVTCTDTGTVYCDRYYFSTVLETGGGINADSLYTVMTAATDNLSKIELSDEGETSLHQVSAFEVGTADYIAFYYNTGETLLFIPSDGVPITSIAFTPDENGRMDIMISYDPSALAMSGSAVRIGYRLCYSGSDISFDFLSQVREETSLLGEGDISVSGGSCTGYDPARGVYGFVFDGDADSLSVTLVSSVNRYIYLSVTGYKGDLTAFDFSGNRLPLLLGTDVSVFGVYLNAGETVSVRLDGDEMQDTRTDISGYGISYNNAVGRRTGVNFTSASYECLSSFYTQTVYSGRTEDGAAEVRLMLTEAGDRVGIAWYDLEISFVKNVAVRGLSETFRLFTFNSDNTGEIFYTDVSDGFVRRKLSDIYGGDNVFTLGSAFPYIGLIPEEESVSAAVIKSFSATAGISPMTSALHVGCADGVLFLSPTGDLLKNDTVTFTLGDRVSLSAVLPVCPDKDGCESFIEGIRSDYGNGYLATAEKGEVVSLSPVPTVRANPDGQSVFAVRGGSETLPVKAEGFASYVLPAVTVDGEVYVPETYDVYIAADGTFGFVFTVPVNSHISVTR